ncbi:Cyclin CCL1 [Cytospora mali]|uniref:Cyclin CCL1 n=1 Tax=Cytospora mali TaxID=578113 RepID=A0A194V086_CYTMA|nr:Cyclin CCL1 [Valsa mali var. pyri (nom. inval.)]
MATEDERYRQSTQFRFWSFSPGQLAELRAKTNSLAKQNISERLSSSILPLPTMSATASANPSGSNTPASEQVSTATAPADVPINFNDRPPLPDFLTPAEEEQLLRFYTVEALRAAEFCRLPTEIRATAAIFLRRFFLTHSIMTYPPTKMLKTCLFFGAKAENSYPRVSSFAENFPNTTGEEILAGEFLLCQGLRFAFDVRHPYRALEGAIMQLRSSGDIDDVRITKAQSRGREILKFSPLVTDAYFHYTPSQIMLAALSIADHDLFERMIELAFVEANGNTNPQKAEAITQVIKGKTISTVLACKEMLMQEPPERLSDFYGTPEANSLMKPLIKKLKKCRDPDRFDLIALHKKRLEFRENETKSAKSQMEEDGAVFGGRINGVPKSDADHDSKRRKVAADDPFGPPL